jgi:hypothetical protein
MKKSASNSSQSLALDSHSVIRYYVSLQLGLDLSPELNALSSRRYTAQQWLALLDPLYQNAFYVNDSEQHATI